MANPPASGPSPSAMIGMSAPIKFALALGLAASLGLGAAGCAGELDEGPSVLTLQEGLTGCRGQASSAIPASGVYYLTSFGFTSSDDGIMSCGSYTRGGSWYYAASRQRYGCGARIEIEANGKCVVAQTDDYGPDVCVESAVQGPIMDVSPLISQHLYGSRSAGWSDRFKVKVTKVAATTPLGPRACGSVTPTPTPTPTPDAHADPDARVVLQLGDPQQDRARRHLRAIRLRRRLVQVRRRRLEGRQHRLHHALPLVPLRLAQQERRPAQLRRVPLRRHLVPVRRRRRVGVTGRQRLRPRRHLLHHVLALK